MNEDENLDEQELNNEENEQEEQNSNQMMQSNSSQIRNNVQKKMKDAVIKNAKKNSLLKAIGPLLIKLALILLIIIIVIGLIMFLVTMPGMAMEKLKELSRMIGNEIASWFGEDTTVLNVTDEQIYDVLNYLEEMGYDLKGYGFLTDYITSKEGISNENGVVLDTEQGVVRDNDDKIIKAESDFIFTYLVSDNYTYTIANYNKVTTDTGDSYEGFWGALRRIADGATALWAKASNIMFNDGYRWGKGLINIYYDKNQTVGEFGDYFGSTIGDSVFKVNSVTINTEETPATLEIRKGWGANTMKYSLEGWTGRYGMPIDFLLSVHLATFMPDLAYDMVKSFNTQVVMLFHKIEGKAVGAYNTGGGYVTYEQMEDIVGTEFWGIGLSKKEAKEIMITYHITSPDSCEGVTEITQKEVYSKDDIQMETFGGVANTAEIYNTIRDKMNELGYEGDLPSNVDENSITRLFNENDTPEIQEMPLPGGYLSYTNSDGNSYALLKYDNNYSKHVTQIWNGKFVDEQGKEHTCDYTVNFDIKYVKFKGIIDNGQAFDVFETYKATNPDSEKPIKDCIEERGQIYSFADITDYKITRGPTEEEREALPDDWSELKCSNIPIETCDTCCDVCKEYIYNIYKKIKKADVTGFETYQPYIAYVKNHWYRDVYFVDADQDFVAYDLEYEAKMKERWTLYETYTEEENSEKAGEYKLYTLDGEPYPRTEEDAKKENKIVTKKAKKLTDFAAEEGMNREDLLEDLGWKPNVNGTWSAYEEAGDVTVIDYESVDNEDTNICAQVSTQKNIVQKGDGLRAETNSKIKNIFLKNQYFRYDGNPDKAEIITKLREKIDENTNYYGPVKGSRNGSNVDYTDIEVEIDGNTYKASDYAGTVNLTQDSLNAFSMLENTHTLDADYIYRDFKELVVELGYFTKEELTDETPRLLQWLVPETGSCGFPRRSIDKNENEMGTLIHSEGDISANLENILRDFNNANDGLTGSPEGAGRENNNPEDNPNNGRTPEVSGLEIKNFENNKYAVGKFASLDALPMSNFDNVGAIQNLSPATYDYTPTGDSGYGTKTGDLEINGISYEVWAQTHSTCTLFSFAFVAQAYTGEPMDTYCRKSGSTEFVNATSEGQGGNAYWMQGGGLLDSCFETLDIKGQYYHPGDSNVGELVAEALGEGKPVYFYGDYKASAGYHAVVLLGASTENGLLIYNPGYGTIESYNSGSGFADSLSSFIANHFKHKLFIPDEVPDGVKKQDNAEMYKGYSGNQAVVSPVTGILLEYGTYDEEKSSVSKTEYRENVDYKYGTSKKNLGSNPNNNPNGHNNPENPNENIEKIKDKVGYAKILVLDLENYEELESKTSNKWQAEDLLKLSSSESSKRIIPTEVLTDKKQLKDKDEWTDINKTVYGYKEFAESYEKYGIAGYTVYIDGFKCELPDEELAKQVGEDDIKIEEKIPEGEELTLDDFKVLENELSSEELPMSLYEPDEEYKLSSKKLTDKLNAETKIKEAASPAITLESAGDNGEDLVFIKEGTVLGRTLTDTELLESSDFRNKKYGTYENLRGKNKPKDEDAQIIGNYLRIIFRNNDETVVENVEDYMKLDDGIVDTTINDWELFYWLPFESGAADVTDSYIAGRYTGPACVSTCSTGEVGVGIVQETSLTSDGMCNQRDQFIPFMKENYPEFYSVLAFLDGKDAQYYWDDYNGGNAVQNALLACDKMDHDKFLKAQMEEAKEYYYEPLIEDYPWIEDRPSCVQAEILHLKLWGAKAWIDIGKNYQNKTNEEILNRVRNAIANTGSTAGSASGDETKDRAWSEPEIGFGILAGKLTKEEIEEWVRTNDISILKDNGIEYRGP